MSELHRSETAFEQGAADPHGSDSWPAGKSAPGMWEPSQRQLFDPRRKSPLLAAALAAIPGVGQLYIGYYVRGFATAAAFLAAAVLGGSSPGALGPVFGLSAVFIWVFNVVDAGRTAALYNHVAAGSNVTRMPEDFKLPKVGGSILGGIALLLFGGIALSNTAFDYSLEWLEDWWPVFVLAFGAYLLVRGVMDVMAARVQGDDHDQG